ncbi:MAG: flagellar biosynthesis anti-sigma factor FlgM [Desulfatiglandales bacterium]
MKINDVYNNVTLMGHSKEMMASKKAEEEVAQAQEPGNRREAGAAVDFSKASAEFRRAAEIMEKDDMDRAERVNRIKAQVEAGTYRVDNVKVAEKIIQSVLTGLMDP